MNTNSNDLLNSMLEGLSKVEFISLEDIPGIELYMDQVTTLMEMHFPLPNGMKKTRF